MSKIFLFQAIQFSQTVLIQPIQFSISIVLVHRQLNVKTVLFRTIQFSVPTVSMLKTVLFLKIQFNISMQFSYIWPIDRNLSGTTTPGQSGPGSDSNEGVLRIPQTPSITGTSPSYCLVSYPGHLLGGGLIPCRGAFNLFFSPSRQGKLVWWLTYWTTTLW